MRMHFDPWSLMIIALTLILFVVALFITGFKHDQVQDLLLAMRNSTQVPDPGA